MTDIQGVDAGEFAGPLPEQQIEKLTGAQLTRGHIGRYAAKTTAGYSHFGKIHQLLPVVSDPDGLWLITVDWSPMPGVAGKRVRSKLRFSDPIELLAGEPPRG